MTIAFHLHAESALLLSLFEIRLRTFLLRVAKASPEHTFIIYDHHTAAGQLPANCSIHPPRDFGAGDWLKRSLGKPTQPADLRFMQFDINRKAPKGSLLMITDLSPLVHPEHFSKSKRLRFRKRLIKAIDAAGAVIVFSDYYREWLRSELGVPNEKLQCWQAGDQLISKAPGAKEEGDIKEQYTGGTAYFLFAGDLHPRHELITLLKAYSDFKKWQRSGMKLVLAGNASPWSVELENLLSSYKYKQDVVLIINPAAEEFEQLLTAAYCVVYPALYDPFPEMIRSALALKLPVITSDIPEIRSMAGERVIYAQANAIALSQQMQHIYKDESWRAEVISKASHVPESYTAAVPDFLRLASGLH